MIMLLVVPFGCQAHNYKGYMPERTKMFTEAIEMYFKENYNLKLQDKLNIIVTDNLQEYDHLMRILDFNKAKVTTYDTSAVTDGNQILINSEGLNEQQFCFVLAHEMVHNYQIEYWKNVAKDYVMLEGLADVIASDISKHKIDIADHGIPYENLKSEREYFNNLSEDAKRTLEQIRYYAKQNPNFKAKCH